MSMEGLAFQLQHQFETIYCYKCSIGFAVPASVRSRWQENGETFYCPNGHSQHYTESDIQKLQKQLAAVQRQKDWAEQNARSERLAREVTERRLIGQKAAKTRLRNRIKNGVCPCCTRSFANLAAHMKTKHPEFQADEDSSPRRDTADK